MKNNEKTRKKKNQDGPIVIELNLSLTVGIIGAIIAIIVAITTVKVITTMIQANENKNAANESDINQYETYVTSTTKNESGNIVEDKDSNGNVIKIPVPKGYTASQIDGETSLNKGFVIYEGDVDWSSVLVNSQSTKSAETQSINNTESTQSTTTSTESMNTQPTVENTENSITQATITSSTENELTSDEGANDEEKINSVSVNDENSNKITSATKNTENTKDENKTQITETTKEKENNNTTKTTKNEENNNATETTQQNVTSSTTNSTKSTKKEEIIEENKATTSTEKTNNKINDENTTEEMINIVDSEADTTNDTGTTGSTELTLEEQQTKNIFDLQKERNQYVWVPIDDISKIYGVDNNGKLWGKLYNFSSSGRSNRNWTETNGIMNITNVTNYREPDILGDFSNYRYDTDGYSYMHNSGLGQTRYEMLAQELEQKYLEIIESIKKYGGFYIGRYETGGLSSTAVINKMNTDIGSQNWYTMYKKCLALKGNNNNITTMMITGSLWDETLDWIVSSGATNSEGTALTYQLVGSNSTTFGNYYNATFNYIAKDAEMPTATETKAISTNTRIPAGSAEYTKINNIYDMAGNVYDWTTEAYSTYCRVCRGGYYNVNGNSYPMAYRVNNVPASATVAYGCRAALYIK